MLSLAANLYTPQIMLRLHFDARTSLRRVVIHGLRSEAVSHVPLTESDIYWELGFVAQGWKDIKNQLTLYWVTSVSQ